VRRWRDMRIDACRATRTRGEQSDTMLDLRMRCLDRRIDELDDAIALVADTHTIHALDQAVAGLAQLTPIDGCADSAALTAAAPPPEQPGARTKADAITRTLDQITAKSRAGRFEGLLDLSNKAVADARALGHVPTLANALDVLGKIQLQLAQQDAAEATFRELTQIAARAHDDRDEAFAWTKLVGLIGNDKGKIEEAMTLVPAANAAVLRAGEPVDLRAGLLYVEGQVLDWSPKPADGLAKLDEARDLLEKAGAGDPSSHLAALYADVLFEMGSAKDNLGDTDGAVAMFHRSIDLNRTLFGPESPDEAYSWHNMGEALRLAARYDEAQQAYATAIRIREARIGDSPTLAASLMAMGTSYSDQRDYAKALPYIERALAMYRKTATPDDPQLASALMSRAMMIEHMGQKAEAEQAYDEALDLFQRTGTRTLNLPITLYNRGEHFRAAKQYDKALADFDRSIELFVELRGKDDEYALYPLESKGMTFLMMNRPADAIAPLERARAVHGTGGAAVQDALARFYLGRAMVESGKDRAGGLVLARTARKDLDHADPAEIAAIDKWLATHR
ncbi:MAG TPA: tetratricopeptide repeat protein, partial [Kofleriaceae bacterium]|nr:tetratricopeptide repeat protein [Kofleriaceae bacterium]